VHDDNHDDNDDDDYNGWYKKTKNCQSQDDRNDLEVRMTNRIRR